MLTIETKYLDGEPCKECGSFALVGTELNDGSYKVECEKCGWERWYD